MIMGADISVIVFRVHNSELCRDIVLSILDKAIALNNYNLLVNFILGINIIFGINLILRVALV